MAFESAIDNAIELFYKEDHKVKQLTEEKIESFKKLAQQKTSQESCNDDWNPYEISGGNYDDAYFLGCNDADIQNDRFILDLFEIKY